MINVAVTFTTTHSAVTISFPSQYFPLKKREKKGVCEYIFQTQEAIEKQEEEAVSLVLTVKVCVGSALKRRASTFVPPSSIGTVGR